MKPPTTSDNSLAPALGYVGTKTRVKFVESCLEQDKIIFTRGKIINLSTAYELNFSGSNNN